MFAKNISIREVCKPIENQMHNFSGLPIRTIVMTKSAMLSVTGGQQGANGGGVTIRSHRAWR